MFDGLRAQEAWSHGLGWVSLLLLGGCFGAGSLSLAEAKAVYYDPTVKEIVVADCGRCHSGTVRNLMDYDSLKAYADNGMLAAMINGSMRRFAGNDLPILAAWIDSGSLEKPPGAVNAGRAAAGRSVFYDPAIKDVIDRDCSRCHAGQARNLMDYDNLKAYADSGMLDAMVLGQMARFASGDATLILAWIESGAQEKQGPAAAAFWSLPSGAAGHANRPPAVDVALPGGERMSYSNTIRYVLEADCLQCHSGQFRNLTTFENVKFYVDNGLLKPLVQRGGPMHRFAGADSRLIIQWVDSGAPR